LNKAFLISQDLIEAVGIYPNDSSLLKRKRGCLFWPNNCHCIPMSYAYACCSHHTRRSIWPTTNTRRGV